ncbi:MAG: PcfB family protein [Ruminococcus sp.]|nr:PcfB family protein [Ruminococcus sp.]
MNNSGDAAEQVVRLSLEGFEVAAKLTGSAAKEVAVLLISVLKQEHKTKGKARLTNMIKSGKELKVFSIQQKDLKQFVQQAKRYGVLYNVLRDRNSNSSSAEVDIIARAEDASKIQRIVERFNMGATVDKASIVSEIEKSKAERSETEIERPTKTKGQLLLEEAMGKPINKDGVSENPIVAKTDKDPPLRQNSDLISADKGGSVKEADRPSVREKLERFKVQAQKRKEAAEPEKTSESKSKSKNGKTTHKQPKKKRYKPKHSKSKVR